MSPCFARRQGLVCSFEFFRGTPRKRSFPAFFVQKSTSEPSRKFRIPRSVSGVLFCVFLSILFCIFFDARNDAALCRPCGKRESDLFNNRVKSESRERDSRKKSHGRGDAKQRLFRGFCGFYGKPSMVRGHVFMGTRRTCGSHGSHRRMSASALRCFLARGNLRLCALCLRTFLTEKRQTGEEGTAGGRGRFGGVGSVGEAGDQRG